MKKSLMAVLIIMLFSALFAAPKLTIKEIQFTQNSEDGTYPSKYKGSVVSTQGTVTAINFENNCFFISDAQGAWNGIQVQSNNNPNIGDIIKITATVSESFGCTILANLSQYQVVGKTSIPMPTFISCYELSHNGEQYEGCYVAINNVHVTSKSFGNNVISDDYDECVLGKGFNVHNNSSSWACIRGIVNFSHGQYIINPRTINDFDRYTHTQNNTSWGCVKSLYR